MGTQVDISQYYAAAKRAWGEGSLPPLGDIRATLEPQMDATFGRAMPTEFRRRNGQVVRRNYYAITLSTPWFNALLTLAGEEAMEREFKQTVLHELAHLNQFWLKIPEGHNGHFYGLMERAGYMLRNRFHFDDVNRTVGGSSVTWREVKNYVVQHSPRNIQ